MTSVTDTATDVTETDGLARKMERIGEEVAAPAADEVDLTGRFPAETIDALKSERLLSALVPEAFGGMGASVAEVSDGLVALGRHCASSAMVVAMHHIQVACLVRHGRSPLLRDYLVDLVSKQYLLASATTEVGTGGTWGAASARWT